MSKQRYFGENSMHPITYFIQDSQIDALVERYGCHLEKLDRCQLLQVRVLLTNYLMGQEMMGDQYTIGDAWEDASLHSITADDEVITIADILSEVTIPEAEGLLAALHEYCTVGHARIKTPTEAIVDTLLTYEMPYELAVTAATILKEVDGVRDRTEQEQATLKEMYKFLGTTIRQRREAETISQ